MPRKCLILALAGGLLPSLARSNPIRIAPLETPVGQAPAVLPPAELSEQTPLPLEIPAVQAPERAADPPAAGVLPQPLVLPALQDLVTGLETRGHGSLDATLIAPAGLQDRVVELFDAWASRPGAPARETRQLVLFEEGRVDWGTVAQMPADASVRIRTLMERLVKGLDRRLPDEGLYLAQVDMRFVKNELPIGGFPHIDEGDYLTMTLELHPDGEGTTIYETKDGVNRIITPSGRIAVLGGYLREFNLGVEAPVHSGPERPVPRRATLVAHIASRSGDFRLDPMEVMARGEARLRAIRSALP